jgi:hypothetical protein
MQNLRYPTLLQFQLGLLERRQRGDPSRSSTSNLPEPNGDCEVSLEPMGAEPPQSGEGSEHFLRLNRRGA